MEQQSGGMYNTLKFAIDLTQQLQSLEFTTKQLSEQTGISEDTISKNLSRLVKAGLLEKEEYYTPNKATSDKMKPRGKCRQVKYRIAGDMLEFIRNHLY